MVIQAGQPVFKPGEVSTRGGVVLTPEQIRFGVRGGGGVPTRSIKVELARKKAISGIKEEVERKGLVTSKIRELKSRATSLIQNLRKDFQQKIREFKSRNEMIKAQSDLNKNISNIKSNITQQTTNIQGLNLSQIKTFVSVVTSPVLREIGAPVISEREAQTLSPERRAQFNVIPSSLTLSEIINLSKQQFDKVSPEFSPTTIQKIGDIIITKPLKFLRGEFEFQKEFQKELIQKNIDASSRFRIIKILEDFSSQRRKGELPFGLAEATEVEEAVLRGEKFTPFAPLNFFGKKIGETKTFRKFLKNLEDNHPAIFSLLETIGTKTGVEFLTLLQIGIFFDPAFSIGAVKKGKTSSKQKQVIKEKKGEKQKAISEKDLDAIINELRFKREGKNIRDRTFSEKVLDTRKNFFDKIKETKSPAIRKRQIQQLRDLLKKAHGEKTANKILRELISQEGISLTKIPSQKVKIQKVKIELEIPKIPTIKGAGAIVSSVAKLRNKSRVGEARQLNTERISFAQKSLGERFQDAQKVIEKSSFAFKSGLSFAQATAQAQSSQQRERQKLLQKQITQSKQLTKQVQKQREKQILKQREKSKQRLRLLFFPRLAQKLKTRQKLRLRLRLRKPVKKLKKFGLFFEKEKKEKGRGIPLPKPKGSFDLLIRKRGKFQTIQRRIGFNRALKKGSKIVDNSLRATFRLTKNPLKPLRKDIKAFKVSKVIFRRPKPKSPLRRKLTFVERSKFRLSSKQEIKSIQKARRLKLQTKKKS